jgi:sigma-E factor negative regulatory protein RseC
MEEREERGTVIDCSGGKARVRIERSEACQGCTACTLSDAGTFMICEALDRLGVAPGDHVRIQTRGAGPLSAVLLLFLVPLAFLFAGYGAGALAASRLGLSRSAEAVGALCAVAFFFCSFGLLSLLTRGPRRSGGPQSVIVEKLLDASEGPSRKSGQRYEREQS